MGFGVSFRGIFGVFFGVGFGFLGVGLGGMEAGFAFLLGSSPLAAASFTLADVGFGTVLSHGSGSAPLLGGTVVFCGVCERRKKLHRQQQQQFSRHNL